MNCPYCNETEQDAEDLRDNPYYLTGECSKCNKSFSVDTYRDEFYDENGEVIKQ